MPRKKKLAGPTSPPTTSYSHQAAVDAQARAVRMGLMTGLSATASREAIRTGPACSENGILGHADPVDNYTLQDMPPFMRQLATRGAYAELEEIEARAAKLRAFLGLSRFGAVGSMVKDALAGAVRFVGDPFPGRSMPAVLAGAKLEPASGGADFVGESGGLMPSGHHYRVEAGDEAQITHSAEANAENAHATDLAAANLKMMEQAYGRGKRTDKPRQKPQERRKPEPAPTLRTRKPMSKAARARIAAGAKKAWAARKAADHAAETRKRVSAEGKRRAKARTQLTKRRATDQPPSAVDHALDFVNGQP